MFVYAVTVTIVLVLTIIFNHKRQEQRLFEYQNKIMRGQLDEVNNIFLTMRGWRHDYHNHMQKIRAHLMLGQFEEVNNYIDQMETELESIDLKYKTGNSCVDAILNSKLTLAEKNGLEIKCDVQVPEKLSVQEVDLCVLLGNLVDNAVDACAMMSEKERRFLRIYICVMKKQLYISVSNATKELVRKLDKEYITKKRGSHGYGIRRIDCIVEKYRGFVNRQNEPGVFATEVMLPLEETAE